MVQQKILILGLGSIGKRHLKNLLFLGQRDIYIFDQSPATRSQVSADYKVKAVPSYRECLKEKYDLVFICTPSHLHVKQAVDFAKNKIHIFLEKPISHNLLGTEELVKICRKNNLITMVGCNMRFHPAIRFLKNQLEKKALGRIFTIEHEFGYYLPYWRPGQDYKKNYAVSKQTGGGIILDDIHEFDLLFWLNNFSPIFEAKFLSTNTKSLSINTEDICMASFAFKNKSLGLVRCDYLQQKYTRSCKIIGEKGTLIWDWAESSVVLQKKEATKVVFKKSNYDQNQMFVDELRYFLNQVVNKKPSFNDFTTARNALKIIQENQ